MKKMILPIFLALFTLIFTACEKDKDEKELSKEEAQAMLTASAVSLEAENEAIENSEAVKALKKLSGMNLPFLEEQIDPFQIRAAVSDLGKSSEAKAVAKKSGDEKEFKDIVGTYTYDAATGSWSIAAGQPADKVIVVFPTEESSDNNATLTIHALETVEVKHGIFVVEELTNLKLDLVVNGTKVLNFHLAAKYGENSTPEKFSYTFEIPQYKDEFSLSVSESGLELDRVFSKENVSLISIGVKANVLGFGDDGKPVPGELTGHIQLGTIKVEGKIDFKGIMEVVTLSGGKVFQSLTEKINEKIEIKISSYPGNEKIGMLELGTINHRPEPVIVFNDGSKESMEKYLKSFIEELEKLLEGDEDEDDNLFSFL